MTTEFKRCRCCQETLPASAFSFHKSSQGLYSYCKECARTKDRASKAKPERKQAKAAWAKANPDPEGQRVRYLRWKNKNPDNYKAGYTVQNLKRDADPIQRLYGRVRANINSALRVRGCLKHARTLVLIGLDTWEAFKAHMERQFQPGMTWDNHGQGPGKWNIDHIRPCASFLRLSDPEQQKQAWHYSNLQPLWWEDNMSKGAKYFPVI